VDDEELLCWQPTWLGRMWCRKLTHESIFASFSSAYVKVQVKFKFNSMNVTFTTSRSLI